ncbi:hypothetical protein RQP46_009174 [Phenoliferia psychrophenolica]
MSNPSYTGSPGEEDGPLELGSSGRPGTDLESAPFLAAAASSYPPPPATRAQTALERLASARKGKGKAEGGGGGDGGRRDLIDEEDDEARDGPAGMSFSVRFTEGQEDLVDLWVGERESVREVKRRIRFLRPSLSLDGRPRRLRLIQLGRLLTDGTYLVPYTVKLLSRRAKLVRQEAQGNAEVLFDSAMEGIEAVRREIVAVRGEKDPGPDASAAASSGKGKGKAKESDKWDQLVGAVMEDDKTVWLHCSVGDTMEDDEIEGERVQTTQITPLQGFDRLRDAGFSDQDIATMREEFRANAAASTPADGDEDEHARALEDQWMEGLTGQNDGAGETAQPSQGFTTTLQGLCIGFFVPFLPLFFFHTNLFSTDLKLSISLGLGMK